MNEHDEAIKAARTIVDYCKGRKCVQNCVFYARKSNVCLVRWLADYNWCSQPEMTFKEVQQNINEM